jgi:chemotaxis signal transduction protein
VVDEVEDVLSLDRAQMLSAGDLPRGWEAVVEGAYRLPSGLLLIVDLKRLFTSPLPAAA